jgi:hypothetical protein
MSPTMNTVDVSEEEDIKSTMQTTATTVEIDDETEEPSRVRLFKIFT